ncbi:MAG: SPOR domain-containing protein [Candidatus Korobacteraceae bacterium]
MSTEDGDVTIGPGKLLGLFFMLVVICGVFFAIGYSLGKTSAHEQAMNDKSPLSASLSAPVIGDSSAAKPSAAVAAKSEPEPSAADEQTPGKTEPDLTFFNAVKADKKAAGADAVAPAKTAQEKPAEQKTVAANSPAASAPEVTPLAQPSTKVPAPQSPDVKPAAGGSFVVQIAAVTREEDAAALAGALRKKNYSVFVVNNPAVHDKFYHVQVGPFATLQDADAMKAKLTGEGYNPIVKRT